MNANSPVHTSRPVRLEQLQFLRFLAFLNIFFYHAQVLAWYPYDALPNGLCAVSFFFCLSGFLAGYSSPGKQTMPPLPELGRYMWNKVRKLYPLYLLTILFSFLTSSIPELIASRDYPQLLAILVQLGKHLLLIHAWFPQGYFSFNGVCWFLSTWFFLNLLNYPMACLLNRIRKHEKKQWLLGGMLALALALPAVLGWLGQNRNISYWLYIWPPARMGEYLAAMILGYCIRIRPAGGQGNAGKPSPLFTALELGVLAFWMLWAATVGRLGPAWTEYSVRWLLPNLAVLAVFSLGGGWLSRLFRHPVLVELGNMTLPCFLIHQQIIHLYGDHQGTFTRTPLDRLVPVVFCLLMTLCTARVLRKGLQ